MHPAKTILTCLGTLAAAAVVGGLTLGLMGMADTPAEAAPPAALVPTLAPAVPAQQGFGTIKGRLVWGGAQAPPPTVLVKEGDTTVKDAVAGGEAVCAAKTLVDRGLLVDPETKGIVNAFAYLPRPAGRNPEAEKALLASTPEVVVDQKYCEFIPYSTAMHQNQQITFKSSDPVGHNVRYQGFTNPARNIALPPNGELKSKLVAENRPLGLNCDIHPWMKGWIMVFNHPFFAVTAEDGSFEITGVPAGTQNLVVWQEKVGYATEGAARGVAVTVKPGEVTDLGEIVLDPSKVKR